MPEALSLVVLDDGAGGGVEGLEALGEGLNVIV